MPPFMNDMGIDDFGLLGREVDGANDEVAWNGVPLVGVSVEVSYAASHFGSSIRQN